MIIGQQLLTYYALPFEFASILLFVALVGAIMLAKHDHNQKSKAGALTDTQAADDRSTADVANV